MKLGLHTYSNGRLCLKLTVENDTERDLLKFCLLDGIMSKRGVCYPNPSELLIETDKESKVKP